VAKTHINDIIKEAKTYLPNVDGERILRGYEFAKEAHKGVFRCGGEPYIEHPLETASILMHFKPDEDSIIAALLHDVLEDTDITADEIEKEFGARVIPLLKGLEKLGKIKYQGQERQVENLRKMFLAMAKDIRVILIKLCDRLHNMRTLECLKTEKQKRIAQETLSVYAPIAGRLGIFDIKSELEDLCFRYLHPKAYAEITNELESITGFQKRLIKSGSELLKSTLKKEHIYGQVEGRIKHAYSIFKKLKRKNKNFISELYDIFALRIIVNTEAECYQALGAIHKHWRPLTRRFKDYIANKKNNDYQSLHTTVIGIMPKMNRQPEAIQKLSQQPVEIQIRTKGMDEVAKFGIAAHWQYKEKGGYSIAVPEHKLNWVKSLVTLHENLKSNSEFVETLNVDVFHDRIFSMTPEGDIKDLPQGATPVDFAYSVHTDIGHKCKGAKVDGRIVSLDYKLKNNQVVEILTSKHISPNRYWLSFVITSHAKSAIKHWFNTQERGNLLKEGKDLINKHLIRLGSKKLTGDLGKLKHYEGKTLNTKEREDILEKVGNGSVDAVSVAKKIIPAERLRAQEIDSNTKKRVLAENINLIKKEDILITGERGYKTQLATCCDATVDDKIIGYITRGRGVTIHKADCRVLRGHEKKRFIEASWAGKIKPTYRAQLEIKKRSRIGLLRDIADVFAKNNLSILDLKISKTLIIETIIGNLSMLDRLIEKLQQIPDVFEVKEIATKKPKKKRAKEMEKTAV